MTTENVITSYFTTDATPSVLYSKTIDQNKMIRVEATYNVYKETDFSLVASGKVTSVFTRKTGQNVIRTSATKDVAEFGDLEGNMAGTQPFLELVANTGTNKIDYMMNGNSDSLIWELNGMSYTS